MLIRQPDLLYWLATLRLPMSPTTLKRWLDLYGNFHTLFQANEAALKAVDFNAKHIQAIQSIDWRATERDLQWCEKNQCELILFNDERYPKLLKETVGAPLILFAQGDIQLLHQPQLAIVGTRNPTAIGRGLAEEFAAALSSVGLVITSGLALGIDAASHQGALKNGNKTIAVMGTGLAHIYPLTHKKLAEAIKSNGVLLSEFLPHEPPNAKHFPQRNRIISGLSLGVLIIEAALRSGSLITARNAVEQGREVFAIPGSIHNPLARGCHQLIRQGAKLVETAQDIIEELSPLLKALLPIKEIVKTQPKRKFDKKTRAFLAQIGYEVTSFEAIIARSGLTAGEVSSMLLGLELEGVVQTVTGGYQLI